MYPEEIRSGWNEDTKREQGGGVHDLFCTPGVQLRACPGGEGYLIDGAALNVRK